MDNKPNNSENKMDEFDEVLKIMRKSRQRNAPSQSQDTSSSPSSTASQNKTTTNGSESHKTEDLPDVIKEKPDIKPEKETPVSSKNSDTLIIPISKAKTDTATNDKNQNKPSSVDTDKNGATMIHDKVTPLQKKETGSDSGKTTPSAQNKTNSGDTPIINLDDFDKTDSIPKAKKDDKVKVTFLGSVWFGIIKIVLYIALVLSVSIAIAVTVIHVSNDVFAFVKHSEISITIPNNSNAATIEKMLYDNNFFTGMYDTELAVTVVKNPQKKLSDMLNTTNVLQPIKEAGITDITIHGNYDFSLVVPMDADISVVAWLLDTLDAKTVKTTIKIVVDIPENATTKDVSRILKDAGLIKYPNIFNYYANDKIKKRSYLTGKYIQGEHILHPMMNYDTLLDTLSDYPRSVSGTVRITIPEGLTVNEILDLFQQKGVGRKNDFIEALQGFEYDYKFVEQLSIENISELRFNTDISYRLEGYLFPDTYDFYINENPISAINKLLVNFNKKFDEEYYVRAEELGYTIDEIITIASMIEKEGNNPNDYYYISSVFHNRLKSSQYPFLNSDATLQYASEKRSGLYDLDTALDHPYNTYKYRGLPPGPICNPGIQAIDAALYPEKTNYYYFYTKKNGETVYTRTYEEHQRIVAQDKSN